MYQFIEKKDGSLAIKPVDTGNDIYFFLRKEIAINENKLKVKDATNEEITLPVRYAFIETKTLLPDQVSERTVAVLCPDKITRGLILQIKNSLFVRGYKLKNLQPEVDNEFFDVLMQYQYDQYLPVGGLNLPTLESLDIIP